MTLRKYEKVSLDQLYALARIIRKRILQTSSTAKIPHLGSCLSCVDLLIYLYWKEMLLDTDNPENPEYQETTQEELEQALKGRFVSCNVQYRDDKTDALICNVFVQKPPEGF